jgi:hypothetical protein
MKGIVHFTVGVLAASCVPEVVRAGAAGHPLYFLLGGVAGLLPDTLDFKFLGFFSRHDIEVAPDPLQPDPAMIAEALVLAVHQAAESRKPVRIRLNTIRLAADRWQSYEVVFNPVKKQVEVNMGPVVNTGGQPVDSGGDKAAGASARASLLCPIQNEYQAATRIDILGGPMFGMVPQSDGSVRISFIPWHRQGSHGVLLAVGLGLAGWLAFDALAGVVVCLAMLAHALVDQIGFMGSNWLYPFTRARRPGWKMVYSQDSFANMAMVWCSLALILWNLGNGYAHGRGTHFPNLMQWAVFGCVLPLLLLRALWPRDEA